MVFLFCMLFLFTVLQAQDNLAPLFSEVGLSSQVFTFKAGVLNAPLSLIFATALQTASGISYVVQYNIITGVPVYVSKASDSNSKSIQYDNIELAGHYLLVSNTNNNILLFNSTNGAYITNSPIINFHYGRYLPSQNLYVYSTTTNSTWRYDLNSIAAQPAQIDAFAGLSPYVFFSQNQKVMGVVARDSIKIKLWNTTTWTLIINCSMTNATTFFPSSATFIVNDTKILIIGSNNITEYQFINNSLIPGQIYYNLVLNELINTDSFYNPASNYYFLSYSAYLQGHIGLAGASLSFKFEGPFYNLPFTPKYMRAFNQSSYIFFSNYNWGTLFILRPACSPHCARCFNYTTCYYCIPGYQYMKGYCCLPNEYANISVSLIYNQSACRACPVECNTCQNASYCSSCINSYTLYDGVCCSMRTYLNNTTLTCQMCSVNCQICTNLTVCTQCSSSYQISNGFCCPYGHVWNQNTQMCKDQNTFKCAEYIIVANRLVCGSGMSFAEILAKAEKTIISTPFGRQILTFMSPILFFVDQYWFYVYHNRTYKNLIVTATFLQILSEMNNQRMIMQFFNTTSIQQFTDFSQFFTTDYSNYTFQNILLIDQQQTYFTINAHDLFVWSYTEIIAAYILFKILISLLRCADGNSFFSAVCIKLSQILSINGSLNGVIIAMIETNVVIIVFASVRQTTISFSFNPKDKLNNLIALLFVFAVLTYSFVFYPLFLKYKRREACKILQCSKKSTFNYWFDPSRQVLKCLIISSIHSFCLSSYPLQIYLLATARLAILIVTIVNKHCFKWKIIAFLTILYMIMCVSFDIFLILSYYAFEAEGYDFISKMLTYHSYVQLGLLLGIISIVLCTILAKIGIIIYELSCCHCKNKVTDEQMRKKSKKQKSYYPSLMKEIIQFVFKKRQQKEQKTKEERPNRNCKKEKSRIVYKVNKNNQPQMRINTNTVNQQKKNTRELPQPILLQNNKPTKHQKYKFTLDRVRRQ